MHTDSTSELKQHRLSEASSLADSAKTRDHLENAVDPEMNQISKSATKLPPLKKNKAEEAIVDKTNETLPPPNLERKITQPDKKVTQAQNSYIVRKMNSKRKTLPKKLQQQFKPQFLLRYSQYTTFLSLVNISNNLKITQSQLPKPYTLYVGKGNNSSLIKNLFRNYRPWWIVQEENSENPAINLYWFQIRQNKILEKLKEHPVEEIEKLEYYAEKRDAEDKEEEVKEDKNGKRGNQRSQSLVSKEAIALLSKKVDTPGEKRGSQRGGKNFNKSTDKIMKNSPSTKQHSIRQLKQQVIESENKDQKKPALANPKMWPVYYMYRRIFSGSQLKNLKKLKLIKQDGSLTAQLLRSKMKQIENRSPHIKMHNHLEHNWNLSNKKALFVNVRHYFQARKINPFEYIPMTFHVEKIGDKEYDSFVEEYHRRCEMIVQDEKNVKKPPQYKTAFKPKKRNAWLVKPGENTNRGIGIEVVESLDQIKQILTKDNVDPLGQPRTHIIQQYIMPFLYQKRKFDIRCYILVTSVNGIQKGYWYQDGYIRTACKEFNMKNLANRMIHLTNDAVQKHCEDYGKFEPGNKLSFADFQRYLDNSYNTGEGGSKYKFWQQAYPEMKKLATDSIRSVYTKINPKKKEFSFEIFGLDFLIDENFKVWLIEANTNPCLELSSPLLGRIIPSMLENAFKIAVDPVFPPPSLSQISKMAKKIYLPENPIENNKFQLVFDQIEEGPELKALITNSPEMPFFNIQQEEEEELDSDKENYLDA